MKQILLVVLAGMAGAASKIYADPVPWRRAMQPVRADLKRILIEATVADETDAAAPARVRTQLTNSLDIINNMMNLAPESRRRATMDFIIEGALLDALGSSTARRDQLIAMMKRSLRRRRTVAPLVRGYLNGCARRLDGGTNIPVN